MVGFWGKSDRDNNNNERDAAENRVMFELLEPRILLNGSNVGNPTSNTTPAVVQPSVPQLNVSLTGHGSWTITQGPNGPQLTVTGTDSHSQLTLSTGNGQSSNHDSSDAHFLLTGIDIKGPLGSITGQGIDLQGNFVAESTIGSITLGDIKANSQINLLGTSTTDSDPVQINLGNVTDLSLNSASAIDSLSVIDWLADGKAPSQLTGTTIGTLSSRGDFDASLTLTGPAGSGQQNGHDDNHDQQPTLGNAQIGGALAGGVWYVVGSGTVSAGQVASNWVGDFTQSAAFSTGMGGGQPSQTTGNFAGTLATPDLKSFDVAGNLAGAQLLIGADLGADGSFGGTGINADHFTTGTIESLDVQGSLIGSRIWVGVQPLDDDGFDAGGDTFVGNPANDTVGDFTVGGTIDSASKIEAGAFTGPVRVGHNKFTAISDSHFITHTVDLVPPSLNVALNNATGGGANNLTNDPTTIVSFDDDGGVASLTATLDGLSKNAQNLLAQPIVTGTVTITRQLLQSLANGSAGGALSDGPHTLTVVATDAAGNSTTRSLSFTLDTQPPKVTITSSPPSVTNNPNATITGTVTTENSNDGLSSLTAQLTGATGTAAILNVSPSNGTFTLTSAQLAQLAGATKLADGAYTVQLTAIDAAGNTATHTVAFTLDTQPPKVTITSAPPSFTNNPNATIAGTVTAEAGDSVQSLTAQLTGAAGTATTLSVPLSNGSFTLTTAQLAQLAGVTSLADGGYTVQLTALDVLGNPAGTATVAFTLDTQPPVISAALANDTSNGVGITSDDTISGNLSDATDAVVKFSGGFDATAAANFTDLSGSLNPDGSFTLSPKTLNALAGGTLADGSHTLHLVTTDQAGNTGTFDVSFLLATAAPTLTAGLQTPPDSNNVTNDPTVTGTVAAAQIGNRIASLTAQFVGANGNANTLGVTPDSKGAFSLGARDLAQLVDPTGHTSALANGSYSLQLTALDAAGNATSTVMNFTLNSLAPTLTAGLKTPGINNLTNDPTITGTVTASAASNSIFTSLTAQLIGTHGANAALNLTPDGNGAFTLTPAQLESLAGSARLADGSYTVQLTATDTIGGTSTQDVSFTLVTAAPALTAGLQTTTAPNNVTSNATIVGKVAAPDAGDSIASLTAQLTGSNGTAATLNVTPDNSGAFTLTAVQLAGLAGAAKLADGTYSVQLTAIDAVGNRSVDTVRFTLDTTPLTLTAGLAHNTSVNPTANITSNDTIAGKVTDTANSIAKLTGGFDGTSAANFVDLTSAIQSNGTFTLLPALLAQVAGGSLADGPHTLHLIATDSAGISQSVDVSFTLKTTSPAAPTFNLSPADQVNTTNAASPAAGPTNQTSASTVTLVGTTDPNVAVTLSNGQTTVSDNTGRFQFANVGLVAGTNTLTAQATDAAGNTQSFVQNILQTPSTTAQADAVIQWDQIAVNTVASTASDPVVAARALAIESLTVFDTVNSIDGTQSFLAHENAAADTSVNAAVAAAAHEVLSNLFPAQQQALDALFAQSLSAIPDGQGKIDGVALGTKIADEILGLRANDGSSVAVSDQGSEVAGQWRPTGPTFSLATSPQFANVSPFALTSPGQFLTSISAPPALNSADYAAAVAQVDALGSLTSTRRTADQTAIAQFWAGGSGSVTIGGQWNQIAAQVAQQKGDSLAEDARLFAELNVGEADTGIATWDAKYTFNLWSPVTAIQNADSTLNPALTADPKFTPLITTPEAPGYVETQASFSTAAADILANFFGDNTSFTATSTTPGVAARSFTSFSQAAQEAGSSGVFAGTDFQFSNLAGQQLGKEVGDFVVQAFDISKPAAPPTIVLNQPTGAAPTSTTTNIVTNADPVLSGTVLDGLSGVESLTAQIDGGAVTKVTFDQNGKFSLPTNFPLDGSADGQHTVSFVATNAAGVSSAPLVINVTVATQGPVASFTGLQDGSTIAQGSGLLGTVTPEAGTSLAALNYSFDNGPAVPVVFDAKGNVNQAFDLSTLTVGTHKLTVTAVDTAGNVATTALSVSLAQLIPLTITDIEPPANSGNVGVTFQPQITFSRPVDPKTLNNNDLFLTDSTGAKIATKIVPWADGMHAWLLPVAQNGLPGGQTITLNIVGSAIKGLDGQPLDAAGTGDTVHGSTLTQTFSTVNTAPVAGTSISGTVIDPGPSFAVNSQDNFTIGANGQKVPKFPLAGVEVYVLGHEDQAVFTDAQGHFTLNNVPAGDVKLTIDGRTATNLPQGVVFPNLTVDLNVQPGADNTIGGTQGAVASQVANATNPFLFLPRVESSTFTTLSQTGPTVLKAASNTSIDNLTAAQRDAFSVTVQPNTILDANGNPLPSGTPVGVSIIPKATIQNLLPPGVGQTSLVFTVQVPQDTFFTAPLAVTVPNEFNLPPGTKTNLLTFDYTTGLVTVAGSATVSADGKTVTTDPGVGVTKSGWFAFTPAGSPTGNGPNQSNCGVSNFLSTNVGFTVLKDGLKIAQQFVKGEAKALFNFGSAAVGLFKDSFAVTKSVGQAIIDAASGQGDRVALVLGDLNEALPSVGETLLDFADGLKSVEAAADGEAVVSIVNTISAVTDIAAAVVEEGAQSHCVSSETSLTVGIVNAGLKSIASSTELVLGNGKTAELLKTFADSVSVVQKAISGSEHKEAPSPNSATRASTTSAALSTSGTTTSTDPLLSALLQFQSALNAVVNNPQVSSDAQTLVTALQNAPTESDIVSSINLAYRLSAGDPPSAPFAFTVNGNVIRGTSSADGNVSVFLPPNTTYQYTIVDTRFDRVGFATGTTGPSGTPTTLTNPTWENFSDLPSTAGDGVPDAVYAVLGINPSNPRQIVSGLSNLQAINDGLQATSSLANTTGIIGSVALQGTAQAVKVVADPSGGTGQTAFVATGQGGGLAIVNVSNPLSPVVLSQTALPGNATGVDVSGSFVAVATGNSLQVFSFEAGDTTPTLLHSIAVNATAVKIYNGMAFVNDGKNVDAFDLASGQQLQSLPVSATDSIIGLASNGANLYAIDAANRLFDLAVGSDNKLSVLGSVAVPGGAFQIDNASGRLAVANGIVYVGNNGVGGISYQTVDVSNPGAPSVVSGNFSQVGIDARAIAIDGISLGVTVGTEQFVSQGLPPISSIDIVDTTQPSNTANLVSKFTLPSQPFDVTFGNGMAFVADGTSGLQVVNTQNFDVEGPAPAISIASGPGAGLDPTTLANTTFNFTEAQPVSFGLTVTDKLPIVSTQLLINGNVVATNTNGPNFNLSATLPSLNALAEAIAIGNSTLAPNQVILQLRVTDAAGRVSLSPPINGVLAADTTAPTLVSQNVADGGTIAPSNAQLVFHFSKLLDPNSVTPATFSLLDANGNAVPATSLELLDNGTTVAATFGTLPAGQVQFQIDAANVTDLLGNPLGTTPLVTHLTVAQQFSDTFINAKGGDWNNAANWSAGRVPTTADSVLLQLAPGAIVTIGSGGQAVASLTEQGGGALTISGGSLSVAGDFKVADQLNVSSGTLTLGAGGTVASLNQTGGSIAATGTVTLTGTSTLTKGQLTGGTLLSQGLLTVGDPNNFSFSGFVVGAGAVLENTGTATVVGTISGPGTTILKGLADLENSCLTGPGTLVIAGQGTINSPNLLNGFVLINQGTSTGQSINADSTSVFQNTGTLIVTDQSTFTIKGFGGRFGKFTSSGTIDLGVGSSLQSQDNTTISGSVVGAAGSKVAFGGALTASGQISGASVTFGGTLAGSIMLPASGSLTISGFSDITGSVTGDASTTLVSFANVLTFEAIATLNVGAVQNQGGTIKFLNSPTIGALTVNQFGTAEFDAATTLGALTLNNNGLLTGSGTLTVAGSATINSGTIGRSGRTVLAGNTTLSSVFNGFAGALASISITTGTVENQGTVTWTGSSIFLGGTFVNDAGAVFNSTATSNSVVNGSGGGSGTFINNGTFRQSAGPVTLRSAIFVNNATVEVDSGALNLNGLSGINAFGSFTNNGTIELGPTGSVTGVNIDPKLNDLTYQITSGLTPQPTPIKISEGSNVSFTLSATDDATVTGATLVAVGPSGTTVLASAAGGTSITLTGTLPLIVNNAISDKLTLELRVSDSRNVTRITDIPLQLTPAVVPLTLVSQSLVAGATVTNPISQVSFAFSTPLDPKTVTPASLALTGPGGTTILPTTILFSNFNRNLVVTYGLVAGPYTLHVDATKITDQFGNPLGNSVLTTAFTASPTYTDTWIGPNNGDWSNAANWSTGKVPTASDDVLVNVAAGNAINISTGSFAVRSLVELGGGQVMVDGGSLTINGQASIADPLTISSGTLTTMGEAAISNLVQSGGTLAVSQHTVIGSLVQNSGTISGPGTTIVEGLADLENGTLTGPGTLVIAGQGTINSPTLQNGFVLINQGTSTGGGSINADSTSTFQNPGALIVADHNSFAIKGSGSQFTSSGTIELGVGSSLQSQANTTISGTVVGAAGSNAAFTGTTFTLTASGQISGTNVTTPAGSTVAGSIALPASGSLTLDGFTDITGSVTGDASTTLISFANVATFEATATLNVGAVQANGGTIKFLNSPTIGALTVGRFSFAEFDAATTLSTVTLNNGTLTGSGTLTVTRSATINGGTIGRTGKTVLAGSTTLSSTISSQVTFTSGIIENQGTVTWTGSEFVIGGNSTFVNDAGAVFNDTASNNFLQGSGTFINNGTFLKSGPGTTNVGPLFGGAFVSNGTIEVDSGTLQFGQSLETAGTITIAAGATLGVSGNFASGSNLTLDPSAVLNIGLGSAGAGLLKIGGIATFGGTLVTLPAPNFAPTLGSTIKFASFASQAGTFASVQQGALAPGEALSLDTTVAGQLNLDVVSA